MLSGVILSLSPLCGLYRAVGVGKGDNRGCGELCDGTRGRGEGKDGKERPQRRDSGRESEDVEGLHEPGCREEGKEGDGGGDEEASKGGEREMSDGW